MHVCLIHKLTEKSESLLWGFYVYTICLSCLVKQTETKERWRCYVCIFCMHGTWNMYDCMTISSYAYEQCIFGSHNYILTWLTLWMYVRSERSLGFLVKRTSLEGLPNSTDSAKENPNIFSPAKIIFHNISIQNKKQTVLSICLGFTNKTARLCSMSSGVCLCLSHWVYN